MLGGRIHGMAVVAAIVCLIAVGCGSDEPASPSSETTLTVRQYAELEQLYQAQVPLDRMVGSNDPTTMRRLLAGSGRACGQVDRSDPLLAAVVSGCKQLAANLAALGSLDCKTSKACDELMVSYTATMRKMRDALRRSTPIIERSVSDEACRDALLIPEQRAVIEEAVDALQRFNRAARSGAADKLEAASADVDRAFAGFDDTPSASEQLRDFRAACRPVTG